MLTIRYLSLSMSQEQLSALTIASFQGHHQIVRLLLQRGASVNYRVCSCHAPSNSDASTSRLFFGRRSVVNLAQHCVLITVLEMHACAVGYVWADSAVQRQCLQSYHHRRDATGE